MITRGFHWHVESTVRSFDPRTLAVEEMSVVLTEELDVLDFNVGTGILCRKK